MEITKLKDQIYDKQQQRLVSISCITFNHGKYIRETIEGFLMQETSFPVEILIHDDASADGTTEIIKEYEMKYPNLIFPIYQSENQYSKGVSISATYNWPRARGKFIALCEGDDYWTDPLKLQKQVDFLEKNEEYGLCFTQAKIYYEGEKKMGEKTNFQINSLDDFLIGKTAITCTSVFRSEKMNNYGYFCIKHNIETLDISLWLFLAKMYRVKVLTDCTSVYRVSNNSVSNHYNCINRLKFLERPFLIRKNIASSMGKHKLVIELEKKYFGTLISTCIRFGEMQYLQKICDEAISHGFKIPNIVRILKSVSVFPRLFSFLRIAVFRLIRNPFELRKT